ncbi:MAG: hypothetical protein ACPKOI_03515 [Pleomorphochaeta sp.]
MKRTIQGFRYDTDKAKSICKFDNGLSDDFSFISATIYKTVRSGHYFLAGEGGSLTVFSNHDVKGNRQKGEKIIPISEKDALKIISQVKKYRNEL